MSRPKAKKSAATPFVSTPLANLNWADLEQWAGKTTVSRGRSYQRNGNVSELAISTDGVLIATVTGNERYTTSVTIDPKGTPEDLEGDCTCPVAIDCKHAVATVAEYLQRIADGKTVPIAKDDDRRWEILEAGGESEDDWDDDEDYDDEDEDDDDESRLKKAPLRKPASKKSKRTENWDEKIEGHIRSKSADDLADLVWQLTQRFPVVYSEFREKLALASGDVSQLVIEARKEIRKETSKSSWQDSWGNGGFTPNFDRIRSRLEKLLAGGHADEVVSLGREFLELGIEQIEQAHDEGETIEAFSECLPIIGEALAASSLSLPEKLLFAIDAELGDDFSAMDAAGFQEVFATGTPEAWSEVADTLIRRLKKLPTSDKTDDRFYRNFKRDGLASYIADALKHAGRTGELRDLYESEAKLTGSYERYVKFLVGTKQYDDAILWATEGIAATHKQYPGISAQIMGHLGIIANDRKQWDILAAHAAWKFFSSPRLASFNDLMTAARKAKVEKPVREAALLFLETGKALFQITSEPPPKTMITGRIKSTPSVDPQTTYTIKFSPEWPLPFPNYMLPLLPSNNFNMTRPHLDVLIDMAIAANKPFDVLNWFDKMPKPTGRQPYGYGYQPIAERVADAVKTTHPQRAIDIYLPVLKHHLIEAKKSAYESSVAYLEKLRPIYTTLGRPGDWSLLVASIREQYRNRPNLIQLLKGIEDKSKPILRLGRKPKK